MQTNPSRIAAACGNTAVAAPTNNAGDSVFAEGAVQEAAIQAEIMDGIRTGTPRP